VLGKIATGSAMPDHERPPVGAAVQVGVGERVRHADQDTENDETASDRTRARYGRATIA
jgi:hypothetical protein